MVLSFLHTTIMNPSSLPSYSSHRCPGWKTESVDDKYFCCSPACLLGSLWIIVHPSVFLKQTLQPFRAQLLFYKSVWICLSHRLEAVLLGVQSLQVFCPTGWLMAVNQVYMCPETHIYNNIDGEKREPVGFWHQGTRNVALIGETDFISVQSGNQQFCHSGFIISPLFM